MTAHLIDIARGERPADLVLKNAQVLNVLTGEIYRAHVAVAGRIIAGVGEDYTRGKEVLDLSGLFLLPGLINGHFHLESSLLTPAEYARIAVAHGTTTAIIDPHEIANVLGLAGIQAFIDASRGLPLDYFFMAPSCVPATHLETSGAALPPEELAMLLRDKRVLGLAEMMNFPGVLAKDPGLLKKISLAQRRGKAVDGHAPLLSGKDLNAYIAAGMESDHECTLREEAQEKLRLGMWLMIREGSVARNLRDLLPAVTPANSRRCLFVLDDMETSDLLQHGELDHLLRGAVALGLDPVTAVQMATRNPAERFALKDRGAIAPGLRADLVAVSDLRGFDAIVTVKDGRVVARDGKAPPLPPNSFPPRMLRTVRMRPLQASSFHLRLAGEKAWVIGLIPDQVITRKRLVIVKKNGRREFLPDIEGDILKLAVIERHKRTGKIGLGLVQGFGLKRGALATSVAHDSHNIITVGVSDQEMLRAVEEIEKMQGGFVVVEGRNVKAALPLPVAGLISLEPAEVVASHMAELARAARELGATPANPFLTLSFLALPVIPELKLTDRGLVDVAAFRHIPLEAS